VELKQIVLNIALCLLQTGCLPNHSYNWRRGKETKVSRTIKICLCQKITLSEDTEWSRPWVHVLSDTGQGHSNCSSSYFSRFLCAGLTYVRRNSAAICDQHGASLHVRSLTWGGLFPGRGRHLGAFEKIVPKSYYLFHHVYLSVCPSAWKNSGLDGIFNNLCLPNTILLKIGQE